MYMQNKQLSIFKREYL